MLNNKFMYFTFLSFGGGEIILVFLAILVLFGADKIPEFARMLAKGMNEFRKATDDLKKEFREGTHDFKDDLDESRREIDEHVRDIKDSVSDLKGYDAYEGEKLKNDNHISISKKDSENNAE